jgi:hypothetical protein
LDCQICSDLHYPNHFWLDWQTYYALDCQCHSLQGYQNHSEPDCQMDYVTLVLQTGCDLALLGCQICCGLQDSRKHFVGWRIHCEQDFQMHLTCSFDLCDYQLGWLDHSVLGYLRQTHQG